MKIIILLLVPILLGIVVGSNLSPLMTVVILNQPTVSLPIGVWLIIAIGAGFLASCSIQLLISIDKRRLARQIRQLQSRLQQQDEDVFTYTSSETEADSVRDKPDRAPSGTSRFRSYRSTAAERQDLRSSQPFTPPNRVDDDDDWDEKPASNRQLDWEDSPPPRPKNARSTIDNSPIEDDARFVSSSERLRQQADLEPEDRPLERDRTQTSREVYDADFRLIQPPYKQPLETEFDDDPDSEDFEYEPIDDDDKSPASVKPTSLNRSKPSSNLDDEDWGFDFDDRDTPARAN
ncbi:lipopolysaccharide assembly protein LapA domain-containing protein [Chamaesiphon polymorphus]|uniref:Lipopolysaccharide assembly protein A domain-containing protein n=1 Tax=Chamaesiphon polymorphus CCALA 037 TaxID=2107692 RepID=A0A2T1FYM5_9CYAN|nr:lipopolysaccharide assembly protein LapA domain-containing protein [Chamaesiphon polymorphus]PSB50098.1 hypothetical protein C7B77_23160 [Chamaesiphon polymorphus CCALA 037]